MEYQIIEVANQLIQKGKKPTVALVRAKLSQPVAMPILLKVLQKIDTMTSEQIKQLAASSAHHVPTTNSDPDEITLLKQQVGELQRQVSELTTQLADIKQLVQRAPK